MTLNPVFARISQETVADYVDFVAWRLPGVASISLSAVQPHGRARAELDRLLPDYEVLGASVRAARRRAAAHGIELLNPYCGLPLCVGWHDGLERCVEAVEAAAGGPRALPGIDNRGDKSHGPPCRRCALRTRCGGAWHAWWELRGVGLKAPAVARPPWRGRVGAHQVVLSGVDDRDHDDVPTRWLRLRSLHPAQVPRLLASAATDLAIDLSAAALDPAGPPDRALVSALRRLDRAAARRPPQHRLRTWIRLRGSGPALHRALLLARRLSAVGADGCRGAGSILVTVAQGEARRS